MKTKTYHDGQRAELWAWLKHLNRFKDGTLYVADLIVWGRARKDRYRKRKGGL